MHFIVQTDILVHRQQTETILRRVKSLFAGPGAESYLSACGLIANDTKILLVAYLCEAIINRLEDHLTDTKWHNSRSELLKHLLQYDI